MFNEDAEFEMEYLTRDQAIAIAREQAKRDLSESDAVISYVAFVPGFEDYCRCEFHYEAPHGWVQMYRLLAAEERRPDEQITDQRIREVALAGKVISAIRLYRARHGVGLVEGKAGVERLLDDQPF